MLKKHCCSLQYAKALKKLGVPQQAQYCWSKLPSDHEYFLKTDNGKPSHQSIEQYSAFMLSELAEFFPKDMEWFSGHNIEHRKWSCAYKEPRIEKILGFNAKTEVDARAKTLVHLLQRNAERKESQHAKTIK
jgi:hypothetical protein